MIRGMKLSTSISTFVLLAAVSAHGDSGLMAANPALEAAIASGEAPKTHAILVMRDGRIAYEHYFGPGAAERLADTRSATKSITALAVGLAIDDGAIGGVDDSAFSYLADLAPFAHDGPAKRAITLRDLLTTSSALDCNDDDDASPGNEDRMHEQSRWTRWAVDLPTLPDYARDASGLGPWRYCTAGSVLLGQLVQRAGHEPVDRFIERRLFAPLGIERWEWARSPSGEAMTGGGLRLTARDLGKIAAMLAADGRWGGRQVVPAGWITEALTARRNAYPGLEYGYLFWHHVFQTPCGGLPAWYMAGNGGNAIVVLRELRAAIVVARENFNTRGMHQQTQALLEKYVLPGLACARK